MSAPAGPRRVLFCEVCEDGTVGGSHQILFDLVRALDPARWTPVVVFYQENRFAAALRAEGVPVHVWEAERARERRPFPGGRRPAKLMASFGAIARRARLLRRERIDLVHLNNSPFLGYDDWLPAARLLRIPCITWAVGEPYALPAETLRRRMVADWDRVVAISEHIAAQLRAGGFPEERLHTIVSGIDVAEFTARVKRDRAAVRGELGVGDDEVLVLMVGNLRAWKGQACVVEALRLLAPAVGARVRLAFAGAARPEDADYVAGLEAAVEKDGLAGRVAFLGPRRDVPDLMNAADVAVHASTFPEPFGLVLVEALALGKPLVAARRGGPLEILRGGTGFLHDPERPAELAAILTHLVQDPKLRQDVSERARARAAELDTRRSAPRVQDLYDEVLAG